ncbi:thiamine phosphate synthase [Candidatus Nitrospira bockiana]
MSGLPPNALHGLYVILDAGALQGRSLVESLERAAEGGAQVFQYRDKQASGRELYRRAEALRRAASDAGCLLIINDRCDVALAVEADGVHLGQGDLPLAHARTIMPPGTLIGLSTHDDHQVREAAAGGADYIAFGPIFPTATKPDHEPVVGIEGLRRVRSLTSLPLVAIGGVTLDRVPLIIDAGADGLAVVSAVWQAPDPGWQVRAFIQRLRAGRGPGLE